VVVGNLILEIHHMTLVYWLILFSVAVFSNLLGLNISSAFDSVVTIYILIPLLLIPQILLCGVIVKFDDLQSKTACRDAVPFPGEIMVSRWAFEALAVEQYKGNRYMSVFFEAEREMAQARFRSDIIISELTGYLDQADGWKRLDKPASEISRKLTIIRNEMNKLDAEKILPPFQFTRDLVAERFSSDIAEQAKLHLSGLKIYYNKLYQKVKSEKDRLINKLNKEKGDRYLYEQKMKYQNRSLETWVLNTESNEIYRETPCGIMQKIAPVYKSPDFNYGRAHFLASQKNVAGIHISTLWFNLAIIWMMCAFLYLALYFDLLRKIISWSLFLSVHK
jgi:hypothetical protein